MISLGVAGFASLLLSHPSALKDNCPKSMTATRTVVAPRSLSHPIYGRDLGLLPKEVVITFDDGPDRNTTPAALHELDAACVKATFFIVGTNIPAAAKVPSAVLARGHNVGSHTFSHPNLSDLPLSIAKDEILHGAASRNSAAGDQGKFFRFPFSAQTETLRRYVDQLGLVAIGVDISSMDWDRKTSCIDNVQMIISGLEAKRSGIIVMHDTHPYIGCEVRSVLNYLREKGYSIAQLH